MRWPVPLLSGALYGAMCAVMGLIGDLTVSLLKRSAGVKDTGDLLPGCAARPRCRRAAARPLAPLPGCRCPCVAAPLPGATRALRRPDDGGLLRRSHGGLLDRLDSYLLVAAPAYFFVKWETPHARRARPCP